MQPAMVDSPLPLTKDEQEHFEVIVERLYKMGLATELDGYMIAMLAQAAADYEFHRERSRGSDALAVSDKGVEYLSAAHNAMAAAWKRFEKLASKFGMTPVDRTGLACGEDSGEDAFGQLLKRSMN